MLFRNSDSKVARVPWIFVALYAVESILVYFSLNWSPDRFERRKDYSGRSSVWIRIRRRSRERRSPVSEIVTDTPTICQRDTGQRGRSAMDTPRHEGTPYLIEVTSRPGKYEMYTTKFNIWKRFWTNLYGAWRERRKRERVKGWWVIEERRWVINNF